MKKINLNNKLNINGGIKWSTGLSIGLIGGSINSVLSMINQIIYNNNPNPYYNTSSVYNDSASRLYIRGQSYVSRSTISFGTPYL